MPRNRTSDDADHVPKDLAAEKRSKKPPPKPKPLPEYTPLKVSDLTYGHGQLPQGITSPYEIFSLFFDDETLESLAKHTNMYAEASEQSEKPDHYIRLFTRLVNKNTV